MKTVDVPSSRQVFKYKRSHAVVTAVMAGVSFLVLWFPMNTMLSVILRVYGHDPTAAPVIIAVCTVGLLAVSVGALGQAFFDSVTVDDAGVSTKLFRWFQIKEWMFRFGEIEMMKESVLFKNIKIKLHGGEKLLIYANMVSGKCQLYDFLQKRKGEMQKIECAQ